jgi:phosphoglycerate dehydrogenase-like enzyme
MMNRESFPKIYNKDDLKRIKNLVDLEEDLVIPDTNGFLNEVPSDGQIILSGWGGPGIDRRFLKLMPNLEAIFYGAGSIRGIVSDEFWEKDIVITSSWTANAVPVAEYTFAQIILCLKNTYMFQKNYATQKDKFVKSERFVYGSYKSRVGIISLGMIGRLVLRLLKELDVDVFVYDPFISVEEAYALGIQLMDLENIFKTCHVISLHTPWLPETEGMIRGKHFKSMMPDSSFINTARGAIVNEEEMINVLRDRCDITAVLDVTHPEPPSKDSPLFTMDNVFLTPHIAGSMGSECSRMGSYAVDELERYINGKELQFRITREKFDRMA